MSRKLVALLLGMALLACACSTNKESSSQPPNFKASIVNPAFAKADSLLWWARYDSALAVLMKAKHSLEAVIADSATTEGWRELVRCYVHIGDVLRQKYDFAESQNYFENALPLGLSKLAENDAAVVECYVGKGHLHFDRSQYPAALQNFNQAFKIADPILSADDPLRARIYYGLGMYYWKMHYYETALDYHTRALKIRQNFFGELNAETAESYRMVGRSYWYSFDNDQALLYLYKALNCASSLWGETNPFCALVYTNIGMLYRNKMEFQKAISHFNWALEMGLPFWGENHFDTANLYYCLGFALMGSGNLDSSLPYLLKSLELRQKILGDKHFEVAASYTILGLFYGKKCRFDLAREYHFKSLEINLDLLDDRHTNVLGTYSSIAQEYLKRNEFDRALEYFDKAITSEIRVQSSESLNNISVLNQGRNRYNLMNRLSHKARAHVGRYHLQSHNLPDLHNALLSFIFYSRVIDDIQVRFRADGSKYRVGELARQEYINAIRVALTLFRETGEQQYLHTGFFFAEKSKNPVLLQSIFDAQAKELSAIPDSLLAQGYRLRTEMAYYEQKLVENQKDSSEVAVWRDRRFNTQEQLVNLQRNLERGFPEYSKLKSQIEVVSVEQVQSDLLDENTTLLEYVVAEDSLLIFVLSRDKLEVKTVPKSPTMGVEVERLAWSIVTHNFNDYVRAGHELYRQLIDPIAERIDAKNLIIVPDGQLSTVPFEAFLSREVSPEATEDYSCLPYMLNTNSISYAYSATLLHETQMGNHDLPDNDYVAFAPIFQDGIPAKSRGYNFFQQNAGTNSSVRLTGQLLHSKKEAVGILELFTKTYSLLERWLSNKSRVYLGNDATEKNFKSLKLSLYRYLHFATHGFSNDENPDLSGLVLAQDGSAQEDNVLRLNEIYNLKLQAELVVLSACETALGRIITGEGIIGLVRGFLYAGAQNLLVSQWQVSDAATADLMIAFYAEMLNAESKADAIRQAKLALMQSSPEYAKPFYWASFVLIGR